MASVSDGKPTAGGSGSVSAEAGGAGSGGLAGNAPSTPPFLIADFEAGK
jgi:hypothetical protein